MQLKASDVLGSLSVFGSAFVFYLATVVIRLAEQEVHLEAAFYVFARFFLGFLTVSFSLILRRQGCKPERFDLILLRTITNVGAVYCFFKAVETTTVGEANILNMTYPVFIVLITWFFLKDRGNPSSMKIALFAIVGILFLMKPWELSLQWNNLWGLGSGIFASVAIISLNYSVKYDKVSTLLFFMFGLGSVLIYLVFYQSIYIPNQTEAYYLGLSAGLSIAGQYLLSWGMKFITAVEGSIISSTRILLAATLGPILVAETALNWSGWLGAIILFSSNVLLSLIKTEWWKSKFTPLSTKQVT